ncbi:MAG: Uma2 family endonuclease [Oscillospiraceae bacterium]|nr:Uma2 family endonuclease [Oscillospiraceae bacterium]
MGALPLPKSDTKEKLYTYEDYSKWVLRKGERYELIGGVPYAMASPSVGHQRINGEIFRQIANFLVGSQIQVFNSPFDVCLSGKGKKDKDVLQPDIAVVFDEKKLENEMFCNGAPDLVIEILSPSSRTRDWFIKMSKYRKAGVREYWIVDPRYRQIDVFLFDKDPTGMDESAVMSYTVEDGKIPVSIISGCEVDLRTVFK